MQGPATAVRRDRSRIWAQNGGGSSSIRRVFSSVCEIFPPSIIDAIEHSSRVPQKAYSTPTRGETLSRSPTELRRKRRLPLTSSCPNTLIFIPSAPFSSLKEPS